MTIRDALKKIPYLVLIKKTIRSYFFIRHRKENLLCTLKSDAKILDVGCGNNSPYYTKQLLPNCNYTGLDIGDYNQTKPISADAYIVTSPERFAEEIGKFKNEFDAVISTHNIEHCNDRDGVLDAMIDAVKPNAFLYITFPCEDSINFPNRYGTLNYYDDGTHQGKPPDFNSIFKKLQMKDFSIIYSTKNYKPFFPWFLGMLQERKSRLEKKNYPYTWAYYGFESIIYAKKIR